MSIYNIVKVEGIMRLFTNTLILRLKNNNEFNAANEYRNAYVAL